MTGKNYTTLNEMAAAFSLSKKGFKQRKEVKSLNFHWGKGATGKEKRFLLSELSSKYRVAVSRHRGKKQVRNTIPPEIMDAQRPWLVRILGKILRPIILEALFGAES